MSSILAIEDNVETQILLRNALANEHTIFSCYDLTSARKQLEFKFFDLIILDLLLPDGYGLDFLKDICADDNLAKIPVIILSSKDDSPSRVTGLTLGADDFVSKPFDKDELLARVHSILRRGPIRTSDSTILIKDLFLDLTNQSAFNIQENKKVDLNLTPIEFKIILLLVKNINSKLPRELIRKTIWSEIFVSARNVDTHISKLRKKLNLTQLELLNKRSEGYILQIKKLKNQKNLLTNHDQLPFFER